MPYPNIIKHVKCCKKFERKPYRKKLNRNDKLKNSTNRLLLLNHKNHKNDEDNFIMMAPPGKPGKPGSKIYVKSEPPEKVMGQNTDLYIDNLNGNYYQKIAGTWQLQGNLTGEAGEPGSNILFDNGVPSNMLGKNGDVYIDKTNGFSYFKINDIWVFQLTLIGPKGDKGERGSKIFADIEFPPNNISKNGDLFINTLNGSYYIKIDGEWIYKGNLTGPSSPSGSERLTYNLISTEIVAITTDPVFLSIAYFPWYYSKYSTFINGILIFSTKISDRSLIIRIVDNNNNIIGGPFTVSQSGINVLPFTSPSYDTILAVQISKNAENGTDPSIYGVNLDFTKSV